MKPTLFAVVFAIGSVGLGQGSNLPPPIGGPPWLQPFIVPGYSQLASGLLDQASGIALADFNGDGLLDMATGRTGGGTIRIVPATSQTAFSPWINVNLGITQGVKVVGAPDLNADGLPDVVATVGEGAALVFLMNMGANTFQAITPYYPVNPPTQHTFLNPVLADLDGNGVPEVIVTPYPDAAGSATSILVFHQSLGVVWAVTTINPPLSGTLGGPVEVADFDGNGLNDIAYVDVVGGLHQLRVMSQLTSGTLTGVGPFAVGWTPTAAVIALKAGAVDGDSRVDLVVIWDPVPAYTLPQTWVFAGSAGSTLANANFVPFAPTAPASMPLFLADADQDGMTDVMAGGSCYRLDGALSSSRLWAQIAAAFGGYLVSMETSVGDCDQDGDPDFYALLSVYNVFTGGFYDVYAAVAVNQAISAPGCGSITSSLGTPALGNAAFHLTVSGALPNAPVALAVSLGSLPVPGPACGLAIDPSPSLLLLPNGSAGFGVADATGTKSFPLPLPNDPALLFQAYYAQWVAVDPAGPLFAGTVGFTVSEARKIVIW